MELTIWLSLVAVLVEQVALVVVVLAVIVHRSLAKTLAVAQVQKAFLLFPLEVTLSPSVAAVRSMAVLVLAVMVQIVLLLL